MSSPDPIREYEQDYQFNIDDAKIRLQAQIDFSQTAFKGLTLTNGGAIIALFTFIGNSSAKFDAQRIWWAFTMFVAGLVLNLLATVFAYSSQGFFMNTSLYDAYKAQDGAQGRAPHQYSSDDLRNGRIAHGLAMIGVLFSIICFATGAGYALAGVLSR